MQKLLGTVLRVLINILYLLVQTFRTPYKNSNKLMTSLFNILSIKIQE